MFNEASTWPVSARSISACFDVLSLSEARSSEARLLAAASSYFSSAASTLSL
jgi:hypothetical protein